LLTAKAYVRNWSDSRTRRQKCKLPLLANRSPCFRLHCFVNVATISRVRRSLKIFVKLLVVDTDASVLLGSKLHSPSGRQWLGHCVLRVYTRVDFLCRWRRYFARRLGFGSIPGGAPEDVVQPLNSSQAEVTKLPSGDRREFSIAGMEYGMLSGGDQGLLTYQGTRHHRFERKRP
jgi:uncharacterized protein DUF2500